MSERRELLLRRGAAEPASLSTATDRPGRQRQEVTDTSAQSPWRKRGESPPWNLAPDFRFNGLFVGTLTQCSADADIMQQVNHESEGLSGSVDSDGSSGLGDWGRSPYQQFQDKPKVAKSQGQSAMEMLQELR